MRNLLLFCFVAYAASLYEEEEKPPQIINGNEAKISDYPWQASLQVYISQNGEYQHFCGGSLISKKWILTAAHCCYDKKGKLKVDRVKVFLGTHHIDKADAGSQKLLVDKIISHEQYHGLPNMKNDIALWRLKKKAVTVPHQIEIISLPRKGEHVNKRADVTITGWGVIESVYVGDKSNFSMCGIKVKGDMIKELCERRVGLITSCGIISFIEEYYAQLQPYTLREAQVPVAEQCKRQNICIGKTNNGACMGDSGGPMVQKVKGNWKQFGIASIINGTYACTGTAFYTDISQYIGWISKHLSREG